ncbi:hypothetical protein KQX54_011436 [Cotesia glomerata]|uniref:Uncharacterized protein n=1 Tax=Cotesia glomerata TaxID=32391 RepID=A0AAV7HE02_COTGL|nr:hypothetical protein KQX54_011436 [Cotesia glomerata]
MTRTKLREKQCDAVDDYLAIVSLKKRQTGQIENRQKIKTISEVNEQWKLKLITRSEFLEFAENFIDFRRVLDYYYENSQDLSKPVDINEDENCLSDIGSEIGLDDDENIENIQFCTAGSSADARADTGASTSADSGASISANTGTIDYESEDDNIDEIEEELTEEEKKETEKMSSKEFLLWKIKKVLTASLQLIGDENACDVTPLENNMDAEVSNERVEGNEDSVTNERIMDNHEMNVTTEDNFSSINENGHGASQLNNNGKVKDMSIYT